MWTSVWELCLCFTHSVKSQNASLVVTVVTPIWCPQHLRRAWHFELTSGAGNFKFTSYTFWQLKVLNFNICVHVFIINVAHWRCDTLPHVLTPRSPGVNNKWHTYLASHWSGPSNSASDWSRARPGLRSRTGPNGVPRLGPDLAPTRPEHEDRGKRSGIRTFSVFRDGKVNS